MTRKVLLVGESWVSASTHYKGFDQFGSVTFHTGAGPMTDSLAGSDVTLEHMTAHDAAEHFPYEAAGLSDYEVLILSDIGANTLLLPQEVFVHSRPVPNRLTMIRDWVAGGGNLLMAGGYFSFQGIDGRARWRRTPVEETLPVTCLPYDDRVEIPEGAEAEVMAPDHAVLQNIGSDWPVLLGVNEVELKPSAHLLARLPDAQGGHPLLAVGNYGSGRTAVWTSDIAPHWLPPAFCSWPGYSQLWRNLFSWLASR